jgi:hypothetical protein
MESWKQSSKPQKAQNSLIPNAMPLSTYIVYNCPSQTWRAAIKLQMKMSVCCANMHNASMGLASTKAEKHIWIQEELGDSQHDYVHNNVHSNYDMFRKILPD